ncbi:hypothetical protein B9Q11_01140 [Candidatus Marsarchaeota G2 archaeon ECH_B_SAG-F08]|uniref:Uncharacterized protein n=1 Tax=Candidatus Marsarchaeota G2 archaeon ECH_B_SAG-F08 TaxID=1978165 RepID=A0A2R6BKM2_9ARCH|nr:MAG: hypothetical protein B9Q11_01140 [Candidatus Marsarchaeota G2 archaeon ECH_B_SAG-F08]
MKNMEVYTPGHGLITDSLILQGICRYLAWHSVYDARIIRIGDRFKVNFQHDLRLTDTEYTEYFENLRLACQTYLERQQINSSQIIEKIYTANINLPIFKRWLNQLLDSLNKISLMDFSENHKIVKKEGRNAKGKNLITLYLPLSSVYGKYVITNYRSSQTNYSVCDQCFLFANLGLIYGTTVLRSNKGDKSSVVFTTFLPQTETQLLDLLLLQRLTEFAHHEFLNSDVPLLACPLYFLSFGETMISVENIQALIWRIEKNGNFQRSLDVSLIRLDKILEFISAVKLQIPSWPKIVNKIIQDKSGDGQIILSDIAEALVFGTRDTYKIIRRLVSYVMNGEEKDEIAKVLDKVTLTLERTTKEQ